MGYLVEMDVDEYGALVDGADDLPVDIVDHDWFTPYPVIEQDLEFEWEKGDIGKQPNVFHHYDIQDWVCDEPTYELLMNLAPGDLRLIARARAGQKPLYVLQVMTVLDVVDRASSVIERHATYEILQFPSFFRDKADLVANRIFHIPDSPIDVYAGETIKRELEAAKVKGLRFVAVDWSDRP